DAKIEAIISQVLRKLESTESGVNKMFDELFIMEEQDQSSALSEPYIEGHNTPLEGHNESHDALLEGRSDSRDAPTLPCLG
ncbi:hypothetical protein HAX54_047063, partial [Datura stramonium]|nr:hypothetical protein [Datura stramonium]